MRRHVGNVSHLRLVRQVLSKVEAEGRRLERRKNLAFDSDFLNGLLANKSKMSDGNIIAEELSI